MTHDRLSELVSAAVDGELGADQQVQLDRLFEQSPQACRLRSDLERIDSLMRQVPPVTPPATLHDRILASARLPAARRPRRAFDFARSLSPAVLLRYGAATAAGVLLVALFYRNQPSYGPVDVTEFFGTIAPSAERSSTAVVDAFAVRAQGLSGRVTLERRDDALILDIEVDADREVEILADLGAADVRVRALAQDGNSFESLQIDERSVSLHVLGRQRATVLLQQIEASRTTNQEGKIHLVFSSKGELLQRGTLTTAW